MMVMVGVGPLNLMIGSGGRGVRLLLLSAMARIGHKTGMTSLGGEMTLDKPGRSVGTLRRSLRSGAKRRVPSIELDCARSTRRSCNPRTIRVA